LGPVQNARFVGKVRRYCLHGTKVHEADYPYGNSIFNDNEPPRNTAAATSMLPHILILLLCAKPGLKCASHWSRHAQQTFVGLVSNVDIAPTMMVENIPTTTGELLLFGYRRDIMAEAAMHNCLAYRTMTDDDLENMLAIHGQHTTIHTWWTSFLMLPIVRRMWCPRFAFCLHIVPTIA